MSEAEQTERVITGLIVLLKGFFLFHCVLFKVLSIPFSSL